jgi:predicted ATPase/DNA-binding CsgD family transcriptional regulator
MAASVARQSAADAVGSHGDLSPADLLAQRKALCLTQAELGAALGVAANTVARWERGELRIGHPVRVRAALTRLEAQLLAVGPTERPDVSTNLPARLPPLVGRGDALVELRDLLRSESALVTLTGTAGCGKTRLAIHLAREFVTSFRDGVWLVDLAPLRDPSLVAHTVAAVLGVRERSGEPMLDTLVANLKPRRLLLVLDNCEHLVGAVAALAHALLRGCNGVRLLATSREPLQLDLEITWRVPSLAVPDPLRMQPVPEFDEIVQSPAVRLFVARAQAVDREFDLTTQNAQAAAEVCARLDGLPLAIELAAARTRVMSIEELRHRLDDRFQLLVGTDRGKPNRHRTLQAALDWSHQLLSPDEQILFRCLGVFVGGCQLEAIEAVCSDERAERPDVLELLAGLVEKSLVIKADFGGVARYRQLETLRQYSQQHLRLSGAESSLQRRHAEWCVSLVERAAPQMQTVDEAKWLGRFILELDNLRAALAWCAADTTSERTDIGLRLVDGLRDLWLDRGQHAEARRWTESMLSRSIGRSDRLYARVLHWASQLAMFESDSTQAVLRAQEALKLARELGYAACETHALVQLGILARDRGDLVSATSLFEEALASGKSLGDDESNWRALINLGQARQELGDLDRARDLIEASLTMATRRGDRWGMAASLHNLGRLAAVRGELSNATGYLERSLAQWQGIESDYGRHTLLQSLGQVLVRLGHRERAKAFLSAALRLSRLNGDRTVLARCLETTAELALPGGRAASSLRLLAAADALRDSITTPRRPSERRAYTDTLAAARARLAPDVSGRAEAEGRDMRLEEAVAEAETIVGSRSMARAAAPSASRLTYRQQQVMRLVAEGKTDRQIAAELVLSEKTVGRHLENIFARLGVSSRVAAALVATREHLA